MSPKTRRNEPEREESGQFIKQCGAIIHEDDSRKSPPLFNLHKGKKLKRSTVDHLIEKNVVTKRTKYICQSCVTTMERSIKNKYEDTCMTDKTAASTLSECYGDSSSIELSNLLKECSSVGSKLDETIKKDISALYNDQSKCSFENLLSYDSENWLRNRPPELVELVRTICGFTSATDQHPNESFKIAKAIEYIYGCRNTKLVLPLHFQENLMVYSFSRSKYLLQYNSKIDPAGSQDYISKWMYEQATSPPPVPTGIVRSVFDNEQVIGRTHRVKADNKVPMSIVTSHIYIFQLILRVSYKTVIHLHLMLGYLKNQQMNSGIYF